MHRIFILGCRCKKAGLSPILTLMTPQRRLAQLESNKMPSDNKITVTDIRIPTALLYRTDLAPRALLIYGVLRDNPSLTTKDLAAIFHTERETARKLVRELRNAGLLEKPKSVTTAVVPVDAEE